MPHPVTVARRARTSDGLAVAPSRNGDVLLPEKSVVEICGGMSHMWIRRKLRTDPTFPKLIRVGRRRFYWRNDVLKWLGSPAATEPTPDHKRAAERAEARPPEPAGALRRR